MDIKSILKSIGKFFGLIKDEAVKILNTADKVVNAIKAFEGTPTGQAIEKIVINLLPKPLVSAFVLWLPQIFLALGWAKKKLNQTDDAIIKEALQYLQNISDPEVKAAQLATFNALVSTWQAKNQGVELTIQKAITANQVIHDPNALA